MNKKGEYRITVKQIIENRQPLTSWAEAHLFYGVPREFKEVYHDPKTGDVVFTK